MQKICLTLPTNRECAATISAVAQEAAEAAGRFGAEVHLLILDSSEPGDRAAHSRAIEEIPAHSGVVVHHLDEQRQREFLREVIHRADAPKSELLLDLMLPAGVSYGACTNRAFLIAAALGCASTHRRDSDSRYQSLDGEPVHPLVQELTFLGRRAADAVPDATTSTLTDDDLTKPISLVAASFVGELSVDIAEIEEQDPAAYHDLVSLWGPADLTDEEKARLVAESFRGAGHTPFAGDDSLLSRVDPMHVDMCNTAFHHDVYESVPLPPAVDTIGSDYFLFHTLQCATLPGVRHNRNIVNYYTAERRTDAGFAAYHVRYVKFLLSMLYFNTVYDRMEQAGSGLLDADLRLRAGTIAGFVRDSAGLDRAENTGRLDTLDRAYRRLGGRYTDVADLLQARGPALLDEAQADIEDFALLLENWAPLVRASRSTAVPRTDPRRERTGG
ncbi:DUF6271 family protein [Streptomyces yaizuensis]|uniref:DUF6271 family protein n=1 Tax=Streptomyces yaizuensis TaxID=2989713 RepID=A0ABQ5P3T6_9ACTN|nr:DUF6271 family protein [Streptomyces sp. YSPA8]GLF96906.1 DUF6271 family protein [Streptomyces sp. YSPA8]